MFESFAETMSSRKRSGSGSKRPKEKVVYIYEMIFRTDFKEPTKTNPEFWHEFFLLQPNVESLEIEITKLSCEQLIALKGNINALFCRCIDMLDSGKHIFQIVPTKMCETNDAFFLRIQIIRSEFVIVYKHYVPFSMRFSSGMPRKPALM